MGMLSQMSKTLSRKRGGVPFEIRRIAQIVLKNGKGLPINPLYVVTGPPAWRVK
jgi:hypothetical protein